MKRLCEERCWLICRKLLQEIDYDIYKEYEDDESMYDPIIKILQDNLINVVLPEEHHPDCNCNQCR